MTKINIKNENIFNFGGIYHVADKFDETIGKTIVETLGERRSINAMYQYDDVFRSIACSYMCGGDCLEDVANLKDGLDRRKGTRTPSPDTIGRILKGLATENIGYRCENSNHTYEFNACEKMHELLLKCLLKTGQIKEGQSVNVDFDHQFIPTEKHDACYSYKKAFGYFPGVMTIGDKIVGIENRDGNTNVRFCQSKTLERMLGRLKNVCGVSINIFRADCGSFSEAIVETVSSNCKTFYIRANNCKERTESFDDITDWIDAEIGYEKYAVSSVPFTNFHNINGLRLVIQRQTISHHGTLFDTEYKYRCILTNDWEHAEAEIIGIYNERGASERIFDQMNNDFGWSHLPFSFMNENAVFLLATAIVKNFYSWIIVKISDKVEGLENTSRLKRFIFKFVSVPAKWVRTGRQWVLNLYTNHQFYTEIFT